MKILFLKGSLFVSALFIIFVIPLQAQMISLPNFDVREKFRDCYNEGYNSEYKEIVCSTNWQIQFSLMLTDKNCILFGDTSKRLISSMNINSCMKFDDEIQNCRSLSTLFKTYGSTISVIEDTINFFNTNGAQFDDENPYQILGDSESLPGYFPECLPYSSSVNIKVGLDYDFYPDDVDTLFEEVKHLIFKEGPILAIIDTIKSDFSNDKNTIYSPDSDSTKEHDGFKFLRVVGWRTLKEKLYWVFSYTQGDTWGLNNYKLIPQGAGLTFIHFKIDKNQ